MARSCGWAGSDNSRRCMPPTPTAFRQSTAPRSRTNSLSFVFSSLSCRLHARQHFFDESFELLELIGSGEAYAEIGDAGAAVTLDRIGDTVCRAESHQPAEVHAAAVILL